MKHYYFAYGMNTHLAPVCIGYVQNKINQTQLDLVLNNSYELYTV
jgi:hypothetical protein